MPNDWEQAQGLDRDDPSDASADQDGNGYTNLEEYLHGRALEHRSARFPTTSQELPP
jgi:hypothetical protein